MYKLKPTKLHFQFDQAEQFERDREFERSYLTNTANRSFNNSTAMFCTMNTINDFDQEVFTSPSRSNHLLLLSPNFVKLT